MNKKGIDNFFFTLVRHIHIYILRTVTDVSPTTESTGADSNEDNGIFPSHAGLAVLALTSDGINCTSNAVVLMDTSSCESKIRNT